MQEIQMRLYPREQKRGQQSHCWLDNAILEGRGTEAVQDVGHMLRSLFFIISLREVKENKKRVEGHKDHWAHHS